MSSTDGDAMFGKALLTHARSAAPRDGGAALGVFADWLQEQVNDGPKWVAAADPDATGFVLVVMVVKGDDAPVRVTMMMTEDPGRVARASFPDFGDDFRVWFSYEAYNFWGAR